MSKFDFRFSDYMPERFTESEIQIAIGNILKRDPDRKDSCGCQKTNNSEQQGDDGIIVQFQTNTYYMVLFYITFTFNLHKYTLFVFCLQLPIANS